MVRKPRLVALDSMGFCARKRSPRWQRCGQVVRAAPVAAPSTSFDYAIAHGRPRDVVVAEDGPLWVTTSKTDGHGDREADDDKILSFPLERD